MKHGIFSGSVVKILEVNGQVITINDDGDISCISRKLVKEIDDVHYKAVEDELNSIKIELKQILTRIGKLNEEYSKKNHALYTLLMDARKKELSIVKLLLKNSQDNCQKDS